MKADENKLMTANDSMIVAVNWISRIFVHLDDFCHSTFGKGNSLSPGYLMGSDFPLESTYQLRPWFIELWNTKIVQELRTMLIPLAENEAKHSNHGRLQEGLAFEDELEDPVKFVIRTWPWKEDAATFGLPQALIPVFHRGNVCNSRQGVKSSRNPQEWSINNTNTNTAENRNPLNAFKIDSDRVLESSSMSRDANTQAEDDPLVIS